MKPKKPKASLLSFALLAFAAGAFFILAATAAPFTDTSWVSMGGFPGVNGRVYAAVVDGSGNLYIGGSFTNVGNILATNIAKWNGSAWSPLGLGMNDHVRALAVSGSDVYAGGGFTVAGGTSAKFIAKWNGSSWSALGSGMNNVVWAMGMSGSDLYAGGFFSSAGGSPATNIAKWNGTSWSALGSGIGGDFSPVYALAVLGGDVYAGGLFTTAGDVAAANIARWDGVAWSALGSGLGRTNGYVPIVYALAASGSDLYVEAPSGRLAAARPQTSPNGTGAIGARLAQDLEEPTVTYGIYLRWRSRAVPCMWVARSRRLAAATLIPLPGGTEAVGPRSAWG